MKTSTITIALATLLGFAVAGAIPTPPREPGSIAAPTPQTPDSPLPEATEVAVPLNKRASYNVFITEHDNWTGRSELLGWNTGVCFTLSNGWPGTISSFGPDRGVTCTIYDTAGCTGVQFRPVQYPGYGKLSDIDWNDRIRSYICW